MATTFPLKVGILGGGQLARMLALAAQSVGIRPVLFADRPTDCATSVCADVVFNDGSVETLQKFVGAVDLITIENEFVDLEKLQAAIGSKMIYPGISCLGKIQNKLHQKESLAKARIPALDFLPVETPEQAQEALAQFPHGIVFKQAFRGYDGKGTFIFKQGQYDGDLFWRENSNFRGYAEPLATFKKELAVVIARSIKGEIKAFPVVETDQSGGICHWAAAPARVKKNVAQKALRLGRKTIEAFDGVGVFGIEMFLLSGDRVVINEIAPRVHNSGHWTLNGCGVSQFEQHLRAISGLPLLKTGLSLPAMAMVNILGREQRVLEPHSTIEVRGKGSVANLEEDTWIYWYGKSGPTMKRKLGHVNAGGGRVETALKKAQKARDRLGI